MEFTIRQIAELLNGEVEGDGSKIITHLDKIQEGAPGGISFLSNLKYETFIYETNCTAVVVSEDFLPKQKIKPVLLRVKNPYSGFTELLQVFTENKKYEKSGIESPNFIGEGNKLGENIYLAAFCYLDRNVKIGNNVKIYPHVYFQYK